MDLSQLIDGPELTETIGGAEYHFSEVSIEALERFRQWIKRDCPHPLESIKPHLEGLAESDRQYLLERARQDAKSWPPEPGTREGAQALLGSTRGQVEALYEGLRVHHPEITRLQAEVLYRRLKKERGARAEREAKVRRIYAVIFGMADEDESATDDPKAPAGKASPGASSSGPPSNA